MATLRENLSYIKLDAEQRLASQATEAAALLERLVERRLTSGAGQPPYSRRPTWVNARRIPIFEARLRDFAERVSSTLRRDEQGRFLGGKRSRYGTASVWMEGGYAEFRQVVGRQASRVDFNLTGEFLDSLVGRTRPAAGGGLHAWIGFTTQRRRNYPKSRMTNGELAEEIATRGTVDPFDMGGIGPEVVEQILNRMFAG